MPERPLKFCNINWVTCSIHIGGIWSKCTPESHGITGFFTIFHPLQCEGCKWCKTWRNWKIIHLVTCGTNANIFLPHFHCKEKRKIKWMLDRLTKMSFLGESITTHGILTCSTDLYTIQFENLIGKAPARLFFYISTGIHMKRLILRKWHSINKLNYTRYDSIR